MNEDNAQKPSKLSLLSPDLYDLKSSFLTMDTTRRTMIREYTPKKILLLGLSDTGKSSIALKFLYGFPDLAGHGPEENHYTSLRYNNEDYLLHIVDIADLDEYTPLYTSKYSAKVDGYIFVYSLDNRRSFEFIQTLRSKLYDLNQKEVPAILVANKSDLKDLRQISTEEGKGLAKLFRMPYIEVSTHRHSNEFIQRIFEIALKEILKNEDSNRNLKLLKHWSEDRVELLYNIFMFTSFLASMSGLFFITCSLFFIVIGSGFIEHQVIGLIILMISGFLSVALSVFGFFGMRREEKDWILVSKILIIISFIMDVTSLLLRALCPSVPIPGQSSDQHTLDSVDNYKGVYILLYIINYIHLIVLAILFVFSWISREIFIKRRNAPSNRFAQLKA